MIWNFKESSKNSKAAVDDAFAVAYLVWNIPKEDLISQTKEARVVRMRWMMYAILRKKNMTHNFIGDSFKRTHGTVIHGLKKHEVEIVYPEYAENYEKFELEFDKRTRGGDSHPNTIRGAYRSYPTETIGRKELTNIGGFSDYA